ncbi:DinB family protein [Roseococcus sp. DSY-14]|uniref:DinB family protein n=1 Tax=Roseococcus sp. DSY-14 TaxID=3369650 RepID=UPI00387B5A21
MISPDWVRAMAAYNAEMNRRLYRSAATLTEAQRREELGAFFGSVHATLSHLCWADAAWMARLAGWPAPGGNPREGAAMHADWDAMRALRADQDARMEAWAAGLDAPALAGDLTWTNSRGMTSTRPRWLLVTHMFNHGTHHRGQVHVLLTRLGAPVEDTDLPWIV